MPSDTAFALLRTDLGFPPGSVPAPVRRLMQQKLEAAQRRLAAWGVAVDESRPEDLDLLVMTAAWLYRGRAGQTEPPLMLRSALHDRQVSLAVEGGP